MHQIVKFGILIVMFSHITLGTNNLRRSIIFYDAVLLPLGLKQRRVVPDGGPKSACWVSESNVLPRFYVYEPFDRQEATVGNGSMVAFLASNREEVDLSYQAAMLNGGIDEGTPNEREHYGKGYYGAYIRDPDGNKIHIAFRGDLFV